MNNETEELTDKIADALIELSFALSKFSINAHDFVQAISELHAEWEARKNKYHPIFWWIMTLFHGE